MTDLHLNLELPKITELPKLSVSVITETENYRKCQISVITDYRITERPVGLQ
ncbi:MAG: hypothetical protein GY820_37230, partial [Gammaproteobacteria bacterium]|nr:hypothetical protein [Gammaproteobacteria bacterium]